ncbi:MAG: hypothetical protein HWN68_20590 [Desulfobacterales bacterium]|nr:hypothetical protein [Desulfobacterales bacterium]
MAKIGTSIRMDRDVLKWIDERVRERIFASRTHAFKYAVRQLMKREPSNRKSHEYYDAIHRDIKHINKHPRVSSDKKW